MILVVDNYDSFTWNLVHYLAELGAETRVVRNDDLTAAEALALKPEALLLSPGPCTPNEAGICLPLLDSAPLDMPIFGVCLGHQAMGQAFGGDVIRAKSLMHGKTSPIEHEGGSVFAGGRIHVQAGAGVVADSDPAAEYAETKAKARAPMQAAGEAWRYPFGNRG